MKKIVYLGMGILVLLTACSRNDYDTEPLAKTVEQTAPAEVHTIFKSKENLDMWNVTATPHLGTSGKWAYDLEAIYQGDTVIDKPSMSVGGVTVTTNATEPGKVFTLHEFVVENRDLQEITVNLAWEENGRPMIGTVVIEIRMK